jgi:hypothetical protein
MRALYLIGGITVEKLCETPAADEILIPRVRFEKKTPFSPVPAKLIFLERSAWQTMN